MAAETERSSHKVYEKDKIGEVQIADEVVAIIAGLAATEVDGVDSMAGNITNELVGKLGMKNLSKGVKVEVTEEHVSVNMALNLKYGYSIPDVCEKVQEKVKNAIENMTGLTVLDVNIKIAGVRLREGRIPGRPGVLPFLANLFYLDCVVIAVGMDVKCIILVYEEIRLFF